MLIQEHGPLFINVGITFSAMIRLSDMWMLICLKLLITYRESV